MIIMTTMIMIIAMMLITVVRRMKKGTDLFKGPLTGAIQKVFNSSFLGKQRF